MGMYNRESILKSLNSENYYIDKHSLDLFLDDWKIESIYEDEDGLEFYDDLSLEKIKKGISLKAQGYSDEQIIAKLQKMEAKVERSEEPVQPILVKDYLEGLLNTIVIKDIIQRNNFNDVILFQSVLKYLFDNIGNLVSSKKIADSLTSNGRKVDSKTIERYLNALIESFVIYRASRFNIKDKEYLKSLEKYYVVDIGLRHALLGQSNIDVVHMLENIVYLELIRRGYDVYVGKYNDLGIDFVAKDDKNISYFQVAATVRDENVLKRELTSLRSIKDQYPKYLLTLDNDPDTDFNGIQKLNVLEWLI